MQRANSAGRFRHGCTRSYALRRNPSTSFAGPPPLSGEAICKLANAVKIKLTTCTGKHLNANITDTGKGNHRRWQATGGQRGQRANSAGRFRCGCPRKLLPSGKSAGRCGHPLHIPRKAILHTNSNAHVNSFTTAGMVSMDTSVVTAKMWEA